MPALKFTKTAIDKIPFTKIGQSDYFDSETPGLGLRVGTRSKTFFVKADVKDPTTKTGYKTVRKTLGRYGDLTLEQARKELTGYDDKEKGFVPGKRLELKQGNSTANGSGVTMQDMLTAYFQEKRTRDGKGFKPATVTGYTNIITRHFQTWLPLPLSEIARLTPDIVIDRFRQVETDHGPYGARNAFVMLMAIINYALVKYPGVITTNPLNVLRLGKHMKKIEARTDRLEGNEFHTFHNGIQAFNEITRDCYLACLYHGMRSEEAAGLKWEHVNMESRRYSFPTPRTGRHFMFPCVVNLWQS